MFLADLRAVAPAAVPGGSIMGWFVLAVVLAAIVGAGMFLTARR